MPRHVQTALPAEVSVDLRRGAIPLAVQLADALRAAAASGQLRRGDRLPSTRALARHLRISRAVASAAYDQLHAEGWIEGRHGSGTYVTTTPPGPEPAASTQDTVEVSEPTDIDLTPGAPWVEGIDRAVWRRAWRAAAEHPPLSRPQRAGVAEYRQVIAEYLLRHRGIVAGAAAVLPTAGTTAALTELALATLRPGDQVAVEEPGYQRATGALRALGIEVVTVAVDADGLIPSAIPAGVRAVYCSPAHQYPLGARLSAARRVELVHRARERDWLILEDDYDGELRYDVAPLPMLAALAPDVVAHLGTMSKILTPTLGVGWLVAAPPVAKAVLTYRERAGSRPSEAGQRVVIELARSGDLGRHLRRLRRELAERRTMLVNALTAAGIPVHGDDAGAHFVIPLPSLRAEQHVVGAARAHGIRLDGLARHHWGDPTVFGIALSYTACTRAQLSAATPILLEILAGRVEPGPATGISPAR